ncbi:MAG: hypothetical protein DHS80DRAFT_22988 [Piptocephalis tieghemiana]|nr:MAG: hypothetical protein DHS80DRAFT_22988 [Piptocephalis tieghemiana]
MTVLYRLVFITALALTQVAPGLPTPSPSSITFSPYVSSSSLDSSQTSSLVSTITPASSIKHEDPQGLDVFHGKRLIDLAEKYEKKTFQLFPSLKSTFRRVRMAFGWRGTPSSVFSVPKSQNLLNEWIQSTKDFHDILNKVDIFFTGMKTFLARSNRTFDASYETLLLDLWSLQSADLTRALAIYSNTLLRIGRAWDLEDLSSGSLIRFYRSKLSMPKGPSSHPLDARTDSLSVCTLTGKDKTNSIMRIMTISHVAYHSLKKLEASIRAKGCCRSKEITSRRACSLGISRATATSLAFLEGSKYPFLSAISLRQPYTALQRSIEKGTKCNVDLMNRIEEEGERSRADVDFCLTIIPWLIKEVQGSLKRVIGVASSNLVHREGEGEFSDLSSSS